jgi:hypothetical protein
VFAAATAASLCWWAAATTDFQQSLEESTTPLLACFKSAGLLRWEALVVHPNPASALAYVFLLELQQHGNLRFRLLN